MVKLAGLGKLIPNGIELTFIINVWSQEVFFQHFMLHLYCTHHPTLAPDWAGSFSSSTAKITNWCLDLSCCSWPLSEKRSLSYKCSGSWAWQARDNMTNHWENSFINCHWMHMKHKYPAPTVHDKTCVLSWDTHLKLHATQFNKWLKHKHTLIHDLNKSSNLSKNTKSHNLS